VGVGLNNLGSLDLETKEYLDAESCFTQALTVLHLFRTAPHPDLGKVQMNLGKAQYHLQQ
jgi:hypothetical protein